MHAVQIAVMAIALLAGTAITLYFLWFRRFDFLVAKLGEVRFVHPGGFFPALVEVVFQTRTIANRPVTGILHLFLFYGFLLFVPPAAFHVQHGVAEASGASAWPLPHLYTSVLDVVAVLVIVSVIYMAIRRAVKSAMFTHQVEGYIVLALLFSLEASYLVERALHEAGASEAGQAAAWWVHFLILCGYPIIIAWGMQLHRGMGIVNVFIRHMTEVPGDRPVGGADFDSSLMEEEPEDEEAEAELDRKIMAEYRRVGMPRGLVDMSVHPLLDTTACVECGRCNDVCTGREAGLKPRDLLVLPLRDKALLGEVKPLPDPEEEEDEGPSPAERVAEAIDPDILATCTQCRACDAVCPVGNRPSMTALELRGRLHFEGAYPPVQMKEGGANPVSGAGNIFGSDPADRAAFIEKAGMPYYDPEEHEVLLVLGCQGSYSPDAQPAVVATARLLEAAGVKYGVLEDEMCWGEGLLHGGGMMEDWPFYYKDRIEFLTESLGGDPTRLVLTVCPHCRDTIGTQYAALGGAFSNVVSHVGYLAGLQAEGRLTLTPSAATYAVHHPCKAIHHREHRDLDQLLAAAGATGKTAGKSPSVPECCGGGGGGFLWDSPAKANKARWEGLVAETGCQEVVTSCSGCHRMLAIFKGEEDRILDIAEVLAERLPGQSLEAEG